MAAAITQKQHHDCVEAYLVQVEGRESKERINQTENRLLLKIMQPF